MSVGVVNGRMNAGAASPLVFTETSIVVSLSGLAAVLPVESTKTMGLKEEGFPLLLAAVCAYAVNLAPRAAATTTATTSAFMAMPPNTDGDMNRRQ